MKKIIPILCILLMTSCTWVKDDTDSCPYGFWLNLHYTYNMLDVDAAPEYVNEVAIFVYNGKGDYVKRIDVSKPVLQANSHRVRLEGLPEGDYQFVVWSGTGNSHYAISGDRSSMDEFRLSLHSQESSCEELPDLFHGYLATVHYDDTPASYDINMMKNTNQLACLVVPLSEKTQMKPDDYTMKIVTANSAMDARNSLVSDKQTTYTPFIRGEASVDDADYGLLHGIKFSISTLRLMKDTDCRLVLEKKDSGDTVFNISLPEYLGMIGSLYTKQGKPLTIQEYLDRQDFHTIVFFLSEDANQLIQLQVNSWRVRAHNHLKL